MGRRARVAVVLVVLAASLALQSGSPARAEHDSDPCGDITAVFARGSGQGLGFREAPKFFEMIDDRLGDGLVLNNYELGGQAHGGGQYPATGIGIDSFESFRNLLESDLSWTGGLGGEYRASVASGVTEMISYMNSRATRCPGETFVVGGYSQGAQVVGESLDDLSPEVRGRVAYVAFFGDPKLYLPEGRGPFPPACRGREFSPWRRGSVSCWTDNGILEARNPYIPADLEDRTGSWCDRDDPICTSNLAEFVFVNPDHSQYADEGAEMDEAAREIALALEDRLPDEADDIDTSIIIIGVGTEGLDVAFVIDTTGSMAGQIDDAQAIADVVGTGIVSLRGRVALSEYRDAGDPVVAQVVTPLTTDVDAFRAGLDTLFASGGGDIPEALLFALMTTMNELDWTPGATKAAVVITDATYHDPDVASGFTLADVVARSLEIDPVNVYPVVDASLEGFYDGLATQTAGQVIIDTGDTAAALLEAVGEIQMRPIALLANAEYIAQPGDTVTFDASASYDPDAELTSFEWDFDGDGVTDQTTTEAVVDHVYPAPFTGLVEVKVHSADGGVANTVATVQVDTVGLAPLLPVAPSGLQATVDASGPEGRTVTLTWAPGSGGGVVDGWTVSGEGIGVLAALGATETSVTINGVPTGAATFTVSAANAYGQSDPSAVTVPAAALSCATATPTRAGTWRTDVLVGTTGPDVIFGYGGTDLIFGLGGDDLICGGGGIDQLFGDDGNDVLDGGPSLDVLFGGNGFDRCIVGDISLGCEAT